MIISFPALLTRRGLWEIIGRGEVGGGGGGGGEDVNSLLNTRFLIYCSLLGDFCSENIILKKNCQVLKKPQMRMLLKNRKGTFLQIQTEIKSTAINRICKCYVLTAS